MCSSVNTFNTNFLNNNYHFSHSFFSLLEILRSCEIGEKKRKLSISRRSKVRASGSGSMGCIRTLWRTQGIYFCTRYRFIPFSPPSLPVLERHVSPVHLDVNDDVCERFPPLSVDADVGTPGSRLYKPFIDDNVQLTLCRLIFALLRLRAALPPPSSLHHSPRHPSPFRAFPSMHGITVEKSFFSKFFSKENFSNLSYRIFSTLYSLYIKYYYNSIYL